MNFFNAKTTWSNAEFIPLKLCIGAACLFLGSYFHEVIKDYYQVILIVFGITVSWSIFLWLRKMTREKSPETMKQAY